MPNLTGGRQYSAFSIYDSFNYCESNSKNSLRENVAVKLVPIGGLGMDGGRGEEGGEEVEKNVLQKSSFF